MLRGAIGFVPQEPFLFSDTMADNVAFGLDAIRREGRAGGAGGRAGGRQDAERRRRIEQAAAVARLDKDVADFPKGYDTLVGERGITLSGGQKQRTAIARAIVIDPRILILDDALSAVDTYTEEEILSRLRGVMRQRTSIIVSHRISTVRDADQIFVLDRGPHRRARHARRADRGATGSTPTLHTRSSCSKRSWRRRDRSMSMHDDEILGKAYDARLMRRLLGLPAARTGGRSLVAFVGHHRRRRARRSRSPT